MSTSTTNSQRAQEIVSNSFAVYVERLAKVKADTLADNSFKAQAEYKALLAAKEKAVRAVESYELKAVKGNPQYLPFATLVATQAVRAYGKKYGVPSMCDETFLNSEAFADMVRGHGQYFDTAARVASFVVKVHDSFKQGRTKVVAVTPYTEDEKAALRLLIGKVPGYTPEFVENLIAQGRK